MGRYCCNFIDPVCVGSKEAWTEMHICTRACARVQALQQSDRGQFSSLCLHKNVFGFGFMFPMHWSRTEYLNYGLQLTCASRADFWQVTCPLWPASCRTIWRATLPSSTSGTIHFISLVALLHAPDCLVGSKNQVRTHWWVGTHSLGNVALCSQWHRLCAILFPSHSRSSSCTRWSGPWR